MLPDVARFLTMTSVDDLLPQERAIMQRVAALPIDYRAMAVVANIWRTSQAVKLKLERDLLREYGLTWAGFSTLFIIWVWGPVEVRDLAHHQNVARATVTSNVSQLESNGLCRRVPHASDKRMVLIELTEHGLRLIEQLFPRFNEGETAIAAVLSVEEQEMLAQLLRKVYNGLGV